MDRENLAKIKWVGSAGCCTGADTARFFTRFNPVSLLFPFIADMPRDFAGLSDKPNNKQRGCDEFTV